MKVTIASAGLRAKLTGFRTVILDLTVPDTDGPLKISMRLAKQFQIIFVGDTPGDLLRRR